MQSIAIKPRSRSKSLTTSKSDGAAIPFYQAPFIAFIHFICVRTACRCTPKKNWNSTDREKTTDTVPLAYFATRGTRPRQGDLEIECRRRASSSALAPIHTHIHLQRVRTRSWIHFTDLWDLNGAFDRRIQPMHSTCHLPVVPRWGSWCRAACLPSCH